jgi:hypothetical protein
MNNTMTGSMSPTATYSKRTWMLSRVNPDSKAMGTLTIACEYAKGNRVDVEAYTLYRLSPKVGQPPSVNAYELHKADGEVYTVLTGRMDPTGRFCTCQAAQCRTPSCKHLDAMLSLIRQIPIQWFEPIGSEVKPEIKVEPQPATPVAVPATAVTPAPRKRWKAEAEWC